MSHPFNTVEEAQRALAEFDRTAHQEIIEVLDFLLGVELQSPMIVNDMQWLRVSLALEVLSYTANAHVDGTFDENDRVNNAEYVIGQVMAATQFGRPSFRDTCDAKRWCSDWLNKFSLSFA